MNWFKKFMYGRYGVDELSIALLILSIILIFISEMLSKYLYAFGLIAYIPILLYAFRTFSKNIYKRQQENGKYLRMKNALIVWLKQKQVRAKELKTHKYFKCPNCKQTLRVPRRKGKITITCPKCKNKFKGKS
ncbi:zf-TFIIB domain-containing protein [Clostridium saccharobutylicum]|uniref:Zn-finger containing protein n=1 Tax=Clostridium saccharobutylicum DSM 13864 TaxID=1345695 RepID=U5MZL0_CLOSA|nr:zf-TFIIB domain-containing protein [Clostridium saccharobutylicum]AGX45111.1 hypothetical protein CLSA_c41510 [Clostridium saccharobutylicum DSM 13864]AQR92392.1 hypothetical protein CLOSC_41220 [Clostridium saccharobutylicum]AQS02295.1 hypothetical protein CSACC_41280 [Clostridium saccharobutylicum]AQS11899.1 hypothetical protein CLOBY_40570 [Clostridium saccharobutylicum]AQS16278.1 hypothetical protein CLOSACC_41280 [Clostridium saccharobutylicum]